MPPKCAGLLKRCRWPWGRAWWVCASRLRTPPPSWVQGVQLGAGGGRASSAARSACVAASPAWRRWLPAPSPLHRGRDAQPRQRQRLRQPGAVGGLGAVWRHGRRWRMRSWAAAAAPTIHLQPVVPLVPLCTYSSILSTIVHLSIHSRVDELELGGDGAGPLVCQAGAQPRGPEANCASGAGQSRRTQGAVGEATAWAGPAARRQTPRAPPLSAHKWP